MSITHREMLELKRWNTPTLANGWEQITDHSQNHPVFNEEVASDFMPQMGPMIGRAVTLVIRPSDPAPVQANPNAWSEYRRYVAGVAGPKIVVVQDADKPRQRFSFWGEVNANVHRALGCVGTITDGCIRDVDEMTNAGFKAIAQRLTVSHGYSVPVSWGESVEVFGTTVRPGQCIHADQHGFFAIPPEDEDGLLEASRFMDYNECDTLIAAARSAAGKSTEQILADLDEATRQFQKNTQERYGRSGEFSAETAE